MIYPFQPIDRATATLAVSTTSANAQIPKLPTGRAQVRIVNAGSATAFVRLGADNTVAATTADIPILSGASEILTVPNNQAAPLSWIAAITSTGTATLYATAGTGSSH